MFRVTAGLASEAAPLGGWEGPAIKPRGHSLGHYRSACSLMYASTGDLHFKGYCTSSLWRSAGTFATA
ncbi:MAG: glycoside hydrolase family 127 protein [Chloroflexota bacterium]|nr:glycoside hydrolase family 127 protein [Chloroflexota bacterium]